ncbi:MAG TPA: alpha-E domain-containing protein [Candidatus Dormibacteraeota bacterium]|nr:alpha-E domain-containing protein [Candidatus Dormibacteraeota bacterium]
MLSRVADHLYWMSRYLERAEHAVRLLSVNLNLMLDESPASAERRWRRVLAALGDPGNVVWSGDPYVLAEELTFNSADPSSVTSCIVGARENARNVREQISAEQWQWLNQLYLRVARFRIDGNADIQLPPFLGSISEGVHLFQGITDSTMSHGEGWHFIQIGRYLERASATVKLLEIYYREFGKPQHSPEGTDFHEWMGLLRSCTAFEAYCKVYTADLNHDRIMEFLLLSAEFPHSARFSVNHMYGAIEATQQEGDRYRGSTLVRIAGKLRASLGFGQIQEILAQDACAYLESVHACCREIHDTIYRLYIDYPVQTALGGA